MTTKIHPIPCTKVFAQFLHTFTYRIAVSEIPGFKAFDADSYLGLRLLVS